MVIDHPTPPLENQLLGLWKQAFGEHDGFWEMFLETGYSPQRCLCITEGEEVTAALCWFDTFCCNQKLAYLYAVVTHPDHRGKGLCRILMENTHALLAESGYNGILLVPAEKPLWDMYRKMGYENCTFVSEFTCTAGGSPVSLRAVDPEEYAALRRRFLPEGGVIQEGENLTFLAAQAELLAGEDFLLAGWQEKGKFHSMELLGNRTAAPGILRTLGFSEGTFRTPGEDIPFTMFRPLTDCAKRPAYFGFSFD